MRDEKDHTSELGKPLHEEEDRKTGSLLFCLCEPMQRSAKLITLDSGFCVLKVVIVLMSCGVCSSMLAKNRRCWLKHAHGVTCNDHFSKKAVGCQDAINGACKNMCFCIVGVKELECNMLIMCI